MTSYFKSRLPDKIGKSFQRKVEDDKSGDILAKWQCIQDLEVIPECELMSPREIRYVFSRFEIAHRKEFREKYRKEFREDWEFKSEVCEKHNMSGETFDMIDKGLEEAKKGNTSGPIDIEQDFPGLFKEVSDKNDK